MENYSSLTSADTSNQKYAGIALPQKEKEGDAIADRIASGISRFGDLVHRLDAISERVIGPRPREAQNGDEAKVHPGRAPLINRLSVADARLRAHLEDGERILSQLESFI